MDIFPIILSGGSGTRLWPLSRSLYPKQFLPSLSPVTANEERSCSLLGATLDRVRPEAGFKGVTLLCNADHRFLVKEEVERSGSVPRAIILEPTPRNTAPAIAVAALSAINESPEAILLVMPSDHFIENEDRFIQLLWQAARIAASGRLVLFGIKPTQPHTGFGYIRKGEPLRGLAAEAFDVKAFTEKPNLSTAERYLETGQYFWNSGIFVLHASTFLEELEKFEPAILTAAELALAGATQDLGFTRLDQAAFAQSPSISVDRAVMERTRAAVMLTADIGWSDVGSWSTLWEIAPKDENGNYKHGEAILEKTSGCYIHSEKSLVATIGIKDLVVVDTPDALLVADRSQTQDVSRIVTRLKQLNRKEQEQHLRSYRPWGFFETLSIGPRFQVKLLHVNPGGKLSMQMHHHRSEHWIVVQGTAKVTIDDEVKLVRENESVYITATQWHRLENPGKIGLQVIEVQIGSYLGEDDIERTDDIYHRSPDETK